jgi:hypothetical protein
MITLNEIAYNIKNLAYGGKNSLENNISTSQIKHWVHYHRAKLIADNINNGILNFTSLYQVVSEPLHQAVTNSKGVDFYGTNTFKKFNKQNKGDFRNTGYLTYYIPETVMLSHDAAIKEVSVVRSVRDNNQGSMSDYSSPIKIYRKSQSEMAYGDHNKFTSNENPYYIIQRHVDDAAVSIAGKIRLRIFGLQDSPNYFGDLKTPASKNLEFRYKTSYAAIFQNPTELDGFSDETSSYPIPAQYVGDLVQRVLQTEVQVELKTRADEVVDGADDNMKMRASGA